MADSLILSGVKTVKNHKGSEMSLSLTKRGSTEFSLKQWWVEGKSTVYNRCAVFQVKVGNHICKLAVPVSDDSSIRIDHDGEFNFSFYGARNIKRAALFDRDFELIEHYVMPAISGGKVMTVKPAKAAKKPVIQKVELKEPPKKKKVESKLQIKVN